MVTIGKGKIGTAKESRGRVGMLLNADDWAKRGMFPSVKGEVKETAESINSHYVDFLCGCLPCDFESAVPLTDVMCWEIFKKESSESSDAVESVEGIEEGIKGKDWEGIIQMCPSTVEDDLMVEALMGYFKIGEIDAELLRQIHAEKWRLGCCDSMLADVRPEISHKVNGKRKRLILCAWVLVDKEKAEVNSGFMMAVARLLHMKHGQLRRFILMHAKRCGPRCRDCTKILTGPGP